MNQPLHVELEEVQVQDNVLIHSELIGKISKALAQAQGEVSPAEKDAVNPHFKSAYSTLSSSHKSARAPISKYGLACIQCASFVDGVLSLVSLVSHESDQWFKNILTIPSQRSDIHTISSLITYAKRIAYNGFFEIAPSDSEDDGNTGLATQSEQNQNEMKEHKKLRATLNKAFQKCTDLKSLEAQAKKLKGNQHDFWNLKTYNNNSETFGTLYLTHKDRVEKIEKKYTDEAQTKWRERVLTCDLSNFYKLHTEYENDAHRQIPQNEEILNLRAEELGLFDSETNTIILEA